LELTDSASVGVPLIVRFVNKDVASVVHSVELHELVHELESNQTLWRLVNFLTKWIFPEESAILSLLGFLFLDDLKN
jgi:Zn-dependent protease